jgi:hypothetical protein
MMVSEVEKVVLVRDINDNAIALRSSPISIGDTVLVIQDPGGNRVAVRSEQPRIGKKAAVFKTESGDFVAVCSWTGYTSLCPAGTPFDSSVYPQNTPRSDPMYFSCNWDGRGDVYLSGYDDRLACIWADDTISIKIQPSGKGFTRGYSASCHSYINLTSGMTKGENTFTLTIINSRGLSMSYGYIGGVVSGERQNPTILQAI